MRSRLASASTLPVQVDRRLDDCRVDQLIDQLVAQPLDVHRAPAGKMQQCLLALGRAEQAAGAARNGLVLATHDVRAAHRTGRKLLGRRKRGSSPCDARSRRHLGDHVAGTAHDHPVANAHILRSISSWLCKVALVTGHAADEHQLRRATRVSAPVRRPTPRCRAARSAASCAGPLVRHGPAQLARQGRASAEARAN